MLLCGAWIGTVRASPAAAQVRLTQQEALRLAFPAPAAIERRTAFLSEAELEAVRRLAGPDVEVRQRVLTFYVGRQDGEPLGVAYFDAHRVRTLNEVLMIVVGPDHSIRHIEILLFAEPPEYRAPDGWLGQMEGRPLTDALSLKGAVVPMTGATLTSHAAVRAVRRALAYHAVLRPFAEEGRGR